MYFIIHTDGLNNEKDRKKLLDFLQIRTRVEDISKPVFIFIGESAKSVANSFKTSSPLLSGHQVFEYPYILEEGLRQSITTIQHYWAGKDIIIVCNQENCTEVKNILEEFQNSFPDYTFIVESIPEC